MLRGTRSRCSRGAEAAEEAAFAAGVLPSSQATGADSSLGPPMVMQCQ